MKPNRRLPLLLLFLAVLTALLPVTASADTGPKPSVVVAFEGLEGETYYVTLLSERDQYGPWSADGVYEAYHGDRAAFDAFGAYQDPDGFYFLEHYEDCSETHEFSWTYYPPDTFKVLVYFPDYDSYAVTEGVYERYAFDSYYTVNGTDSMKTGLLGPLRETYDYTWQIFSFLGRLVITLAAELALALVFGFRARKQLKVILVTNLATQVILNLLLNFINYKYGAFLFIFNYLWMEAVVFLIEGGVYGLTLKKLAEPLGTKKVRPWLYAFTANLASIVLGLLAARWMPGIF